jgi:hypothetical protein
MPRSFRCPFLYTIAFCRPARKGKPENFSGPRTYGGEVVATDPNL